MNKKNILELLRNRINYIDQEIITLLNQRQSLSIDIANKKINHKIKIRDSVREKLLFKKLYTICLKKNINYQYVKKIFNIIIHDSVQAQETWKKTINQFIINNRIPMCAVLGPQGSYSNLTFNILLKQKKFFLIEHECFDFLSIIKKLNDNTCQFAFLPIKNSIAGIIPETYRILKKEGLYIIKELYVHIQHSLMTLEGVYFSDISHIYSHIQPLKQCSLFINNFSHWKIHYTNSTAHAMKKVFLKGNAQSAAIGHTIGGKFYNLHTIAKNFANNSKNITRFVLLSKKPNEFSCINSLKTTCCIKFIDQNIDFNKIISILKKYNLNVKNITLQPDFNNKEKKTYYFDINKVIDNQTLKTYLQSIQKNIYNIYTLGSYKNEKNIINIE